jgi:hypothetical protein
VLHEAEVRQGALSLALGVCVRVRQVMAEASLGVSVVMRFADVEVGQVASKVGLGVGCTRCSFWSPALIPLDTRWKMSWPAELTSMVTFAKCMSTLPVVSSIL